MLISLSLSIFWNTNRESCHLELHYSSLIKHSWNQLKSCFGANKACCVMALSKVLAEEILICSPGSCVLPEHLAPAPYGLWGWRGTWWLGQVCLLQPWDNHSVIDCSRAVMLKMAYEWEVVPKILWLDVEVIARKAWVLVQGVKCIFWM